MAKPLYLPSVSNLAYVEELYASFLRDPDSVAPRWRRIFREMGDGGPGAAGWSAAPAYRPRSLFQPVARRATDRGAGSATEAALLQERVDQMVRAYRVRGHMVAELDPLGMPRPVPPELDPAYHGITEAEMGRPVSSDTMPGTNVRTVRDILEHLRRTYCRSIGVQSMHITEHAVRVWIRERMESPAHRVELTRDEQRRVLRRLTDAVVFEEFVQRKYTGAKTFSLEGAESLIPLLDRAIERAGEHGVVEIVLAMAHRGRLNVLANIMGKIPQEIFHEFEDTEPERYLGGGDVKYHLGYSNDWQTSAGSTVHLSLCFNPSHLEYVNPVALGRMRAKQDRAGDSEREHGLVLLIHGDAAFIGEGIVQECLNLSQLAGYTTGGTIHVVVNNQIGFTTAPQEGRSCAYATDVARMLEIPIFHVNGEDPEAVAQVVRLALDFRHTFRRDVVIDTYCYRRRGHNEGDEPAFTQPIMYRTIDERPSVRDSYFEHLLALEGISRQEAEAIEEESRRRLQDALDEVRTGRRTAARQDLGGVWSGYHGGPSTLAEEVETGADRGRLAEILEATARVPTGFRPHAKIERFLSRRLEMARGERELDWSAAEALAFGSLAVEGHRVRLSGQDTERGTFSHRHSVLHDVEDGTTWSPLARLSDDQAPVETINSPLSEAAVLGFEYGYSLDFPEGLVMWEAQFGDFANAAQVIIDQFLAAAEDKWRRLSGVVLLLPHGFEGMGPEHSSARLERFLVLAAEDNIQVVYPTTPAQYFHCLRRQVLRRWRKPLVVLTPKSLLRHPRVVSSLEELAGGRFRTVLPDPLDKDPRAVRTVVLSSGKVFYDLEEKREADGRNSVALVRVEQLYPFPESELRAVLETYPSASRLVWVQEEPQNMGAWRYLQWRFRERLGDLPALEGIARAESASPATGSPASHRLEQEALLAQAFAPDVDGAWRGRRTEEVAASKEG